MSVTIDNTKLEKYAKVTEDRAEYDWNGEPAGCRSFIFYYGSIISYS